VIGANMAHRIRSWFLPKTEADTLDISADVSSSADSQAIEDHTSATGGLTRVAASLYWSCSDDVPFPRPSIEEVSCRRLSLVPRPFPRLGTRPARLDDRRDSTPGTKIPFDDGPFRIAGSYDIFQDPIDDVLLKNSEVAVSE
jgi:hypothetical protein